ncbi:MAG: reverse transcriptase family protein [Candidatus Acidiferrum sp.]
MLFEITDRAQLARFLAVAPQEIDYVLRRLDCYYKPANVPKRDGSPRMLLVPHGKLKLLQKKIKLHILDKFPFLDCVHGGVRGRSVVSNALPHVQKPVVFSVDLKDFFPHVTPDRVYRIFLGLGFGEECARILVKATTWKHQLPQGAPTSTGLANLSLVRADWRLRRLAQIQHFSYTRYVDDLTVSGEWRLLKFRKLIPRIVESEGFCVKPQKTVTMHMGERQVVTQLVVNTKVNMPREWRKVVRGQVFARVRGEESNVSLNSVRGRVNWFSYLNRRAGGKLLERISIDECQGARPWQ